ncbi:MAG: hypothetical protein COA79_16570 [Planctomycetota bacterium]|nr:MAG: hypothetical protein COA79_16570 [Planctomycetota bacterium]
MFLFLSPLFLLGISLALIPLIIHILNKSKYKVEKWGAMMFLQKAVKIRARSIKLQQIILMLLRMAVLIFFAIGLARPIIQGQFAGEDDQPVCTVLIVDHSYSMQKKSNANYNKAKEISKKYIRDMKEGDSLYIVLGGSRPNPLFSKPSFDKGFLSEKINAIKVGSGDFNIIKSLEEAFFLLEKSKAPRRRIVVISDEQETNWKINQKLLWDKIKQHYELLKIKPLLYSLNLDEDEKTDNQWIKSISTRSPVIDIYRQNKFVVEIEHIGDKDIKSHLNFYLDGEIYTERDVELKNGTNSFVFDVQIEKAGSHHIKAELEADELPFDNQREFSFEVIERLPVLILEGTSDENPLKSDGGLLSMALEAASQLENKQLFKVDKKPYYELENLTLDSLSSYKAIILANVPSFSQYSIFTLENYVKKGGGLFIFLGDKTTPEAYQKVYKNGQGLLPGLIKKKIERNRKLVSPFFNPGLGRFILEIYNLEEGKQIDEVKINTYWQVSTHKESYTLARIKNDPMLLYKTFGDGRIMMLSVSPDIKWSNYPITPHFLPLVQNVCIYLCGTVKPPLNVSLGEPLIVQLPIVSTKKASDVNLINMIEPNGKINKLTSRFTRGFISSIYKETNNAGLYTVVKSEKEKKYYSVQYPESEGNLKALEEKNKIKLPVKFNFVKTYTELSQYNLEESGAKEVWQYFIYLLLILLLIELYLSGRFNK